MIDRAHWVALSAWFPRCSASERYRRQSNIGTGAVGWTFFIQAAMKRNQFSDLCF